MNHITGEEKLEPEMSPEIVQLVAGEMATILEGVARLMTACHARLPMNPDEQAMLEGERPPDLATDLRGTIECLVNDCLSHAVRMLREMGELTEESVRGRWRKPATD